VARFGFRAGGESGQHLALRPILPQVAERRGVTPDTVMHLARYFCGDVEIRLSLQVADDG